MTDQRKRDYLRRVKARFGPRLISGYEDIGITMADVRWANRVLRRWGGSG